MTNRPTLGAAIITRDSLETLRPLLEQLSELDQVVVLDTGSRDGTPAHVAGLGPPFELHRFTWRHRPASHAPDEWGFAAARNESFSHLGTTHAIWLDSDDTLVEVGAGTRDAATAATVAGILRKAIADWPRADLWQLEYIYDLDRLGNPNIILTVNRMVRLAAGWRWRYPIHEILVPPGDPAEIEAISVEQLAVVHRRHEEETSIKRNDVMTRAWLRQLLHTGAPPEDLARARWLIGRSLRGQRRHRTAERWIVREYLGKHPELSPEERWDGWMEVARSTLQEQDFEGARLAALRAIDQCPRFAESYVLLADTKAGAGEPPEDIIKLLEIAASCGNDVHRPIELNPGYVDFASVLLGAESRLRLGRGVEALSYAERAVQLRPGDGRARLALAHAQNASRQRAAVKGEKEEGAPRGAPSI